VPIFLFAPTISRTPDARFGRAFGTLKLKRSLRVRNPHRRRLEPQAIFGIGVVRGCDKPGTPKKKRGGPLF